MNVKKLARGPILWVVLALGVLLLATQLINPNAATKVDTSQGLELIGGGTVDSALVVDGEQRVELGLSEPYEVRDGQEATRVEFFYVDPRGDEVVQALSDANVATVDDEVPQPSFLGSLLSTLLPLLLLVAIFWFVLSRMQGGGGRIAQFGKSKAKMVSKETPQVTFADVAGADEAVEELQEIKDFLAEPARFQEVGAKIPKGVLLYGSPGTGKTLLARAVAGEAGVPFFSISGSDFVEMFVGVGASRVRDLFEQAKNNAPAIIFVDEIDAVGRHRGAGMGGGHDEREQTLNQLLVEMDGFDVKTNVILIAATNRPDILDPALLRPGRFDRQISVEPPDMKGRERILSVHGKGKPLAPDVDLLAVARRTPGFSGADLANVLNEAALLTARTHAKVIDNAALDEAIDRVIAGPQKRTRLMNDSEKKITAYHEGGHALVAAAMRHTDPVTKVTILPRGRALGYTMVMPSEDKYSTTRNELLDQLAYALGGRVAEEMVFHDPTTGAGNDIEKATGMARKMVTEYGMSERVGAIKLGTAAGEPFMGRDMGHDRGYGEGLASVVDDEVRRLIEAAHDEAWEVVVEHRPVLDALVERLLEKETIDRAELAEIFAPVQKRPLRPVWLSSERRAVSDQPPVLSPAERRRLNGSANGSRNGSSNGHRPPAPQDQAAGVRPEHPAEGAVEVPEGGQVDPASGAERPVAGAGSHETTPSPPRVPSRIGRLETQALTAPSPRPFDVGRAEAAVRELLAAVGEDPDRDGLRDTPTRVARMYAEVLGGLHEDAADVLSTSFDLGHDELVLVRDIEVHSLCEHHLAPFHGVAHVGYVPAADGRITGLSKLARLVDVFARRPQVQERLTTQVADALVEHLRPRGVIVVLECEHLCMSMRGVRKAGARTITSAMRGGLRDPATRAEALSLIHGR